MTHTRTVLFALGAVAAIGVAIALASGLGSAPEPLANERIPLVAPAASQPVVSPMPHERAGDYAETVRGVSFTMKAIPGGTFDMGCGIGDEPCTDDEWADAAAEQRQRTVAVEPFYLAETEMTWALYQTCIDDGVCATNDADGGDNGWGKGNRPVIEVSWNEFTEVFLPWLNAETDRTYRLPTEAEWEYAARAGNTTRYAWSDTIDCTQARYGYMTDDCGAPNSTVPVKTYAPNAFGLYDMHGNVWEFVQDCWSDDPETACIEFVLRGGSWLNGPDEVRSAVRARHERTYRESGDGFRLAHDASG
ncbi:MAG: formylglycine-generating enzyme family protein [Bacteroidota bacterium]